MAELMRHDVLSEGREEEEAAECCRARLARDGGSVAQPSPATREGVGRGLWWGSPEASGEGASGESENRYFF